MKSIIISAAILIVWLSSLHIEVQFKPFKVSFHNWRELVGILLLVLGLIFIKSDYGREQYIKGSKDTLKTLENQIEKLQTTTKA